MIALVEMIASPHQNVRQKFPETQNVINLEQERECSLKKTMKDTDSLIELPIGYGKNGQTCHPLSADHFDVAVK